MVIRLARYVVSGATIGEKPFWRRNSAMDYYYRMSLKNETWAPVSICRKKIGARMGDFDEYHRG
jgi:hypothetical protein